MEFKYVTGRAPSEENEYGTFGIIRVTVMLVSHKNYGSIIYCCPSDLRIFKEEDDDSSRARPSANKNETKEDFVKEVKSIIDDQQTKLQSFIKNFPIFGIL